MLVFRSVRRSMVVAGFAAATVIMSGGFGPAFMMHLAITQLTDHRLRRGEGDGKQREYRGEASEHGFTFE